MRELVSGALFVSVLVALAFLSQCKTAHAVEMPKLDRSGSYHAVRYEFDNISDDIVSRRIVSSGTFKECDDFIQRQGPQIGGSRTHIVYGCEKYDPEKDKT